MSRPHLKEELLRGNKYALARAISLVENESEGYWDLLKGVKMRSTPVFGVTGPPGAGKSTLLNVILRELTKLRKKVGVIAVDPSSALSNGSLLGDRIRMTEHYLEENVFIRSLSSRSALGGLSFKAQEVCDIMGSFGFDYIFIETVGVGQSEIEVAGLADEVILVLVPGAGDEIQHIKSGIIEVGDIYVVNKASMPGADEMVLSLSMILGNGKKHPPIFRTDALTGQGIEELITRIILYPAEIDSERRFSKMKLRVLAIINRVKLQTVNVQDIDRKLRLVINTNDFNAYSFAELFLSTN